MKQASLKSVASGPYRSQNPPWMQSARFTSQIMKAEAESLPYSVLFETKDYDVRISPNQTMQIRRLHKTTEADARQKVDRVMEQLAQTQLPAGIKITSLDKSWSQKELRFSVQAKKAFFKTKIEGTCVVTEKSIVLDFLVPPIVGSFISEDKIRDIIDQNFDKLFSTPKAEG